MDLLRSPGGCPWDAEQTHESLAPYALEEAYEVAEAIEDGDRAGLREELGDLLLQVVFHARVAQEHHTDPFDLDDVARGVAAKLVRRHPHVFARPVPAAGAGSIGIADDVAPATDEMHASWERLKTEEKQRTSILQGIPRAQSALARGAKILGRARRAGLDVGPGAAAPAGAAGVGARLLLLTAEAEAAGVDAEAALRSAVRTLEAAVRDAERS